MKTLIFIFLISIIFETNNQLTAIFMENQKNTHIILKNEK